MGDLKFFALLALVTYVLGGCNSNANSSCPAPDDFAYVNLGCSLAVPPVVKTTGPCSGMMGGGSLGGPAGVLLLTGNGAGTCQLEVTFGTGATTTLDVVFVSQPGPCGAEEFVALDDAGSPCIPSACQLLTQATTCDAGLDAEPSD